MISIKVIKQHLRLTSLKEIQKEEIQNSIVAKMKMQK